MGPVWGCGPERDLSKDIYSRTSESVGKWVGSTDFVAPLSSTPPARNPGKEGPREGKRMSLNPSLASQGENVFFVVTNLIVTPNQQQKTCAEV